MKKPNQDRVFLSLDDVPPALIGEAPKDAKVEGKTFDEYLEQTRAKGIAKLEHGGVLTSHQDQTCLRRG